MTIGFATVDEPDGPRLVAWRDDEVLTLDAVTPDAPRSMRALLDAWERAPELLAAATAAADTWRPVRDGDLLAPVPEPPTIFCAGANYADHITEMTKTPFVRAEDAMPYHFVAAPGALAGHRGTVHRPAATAALDWEVELAVVIGRRAHQVAAVDALDHVAGYTVANDLSLRDLAQRADTPFGIDWLRSKCFTGCLPLGPAVVPRDAVPDPQSLHLRLTVNGAVMQDSSTSEMIFTVTEQIEHLSNIVTLVPGDVICTGTPAGVGFARGTFLAPGDVVVAEIERVGRLETRVT
jgi:2-keto-4-pentenoate hydratase/2-oxohepta-3-ene-1,7-dioic acid hydratase in catechol pathway